MFGSRFDIKQVTDKENPHVLEPFRTIYKKRKFVKPCLVREANLIKCYPNLINQTAL